MSPFEQKDATPWHILLVEDEESLALGLEFNLTEEGYRVSWARDGREALELLKQQEFDLVILDIMLPYADGYEVAQQIRQRSRQTPILFLTARKSAHDRIRGLELGADDYLTKPFDLQEMLLRVRRILERKRWYRPEATDGVHRLGEWEISFSRLEARRGRQTIQLTQREAMVLKYLMDNAGRVVSRQEMLENVWNVTGDLQTRTVDIFIARLRKYFEDDPAHPRLIQSVRGVGYLFHPQQPENKDQPTNS